MAVKSEAVIVISSGDEGVSYLASFPGRRKSVLLRPVNKTGGHGAANLE